MPQILPSQHRVKSSRLRPSYISDTTRIARSSMVSRRTAGLNLLEVWHDGWETWMASAAPILASAILGFAGPFIVFVSLTAWLGLNDYVHISGPLITYQGLALLTIPNTHAFSLLLTQAILVAIPAIGIRMGIVRLMLRRHLFVHLGHLWHALPMVLFGLLSKGVLLGVPVAAINLPLSGTSFDLNNLGQRAYSPGGLSMVVLLRTFNELIPEPGSPFSEFLPLWRQRLNWPSQSDDYEHHLFDQYGSAMSGVAPQPPNHSQDSTLLRVNFLVVCVATVIVLEPLTRFHTIGTLHAMFVGDAPLCGYVRAVTVGVRYFGQVLAHIWALRLAGCALMLLFITIPQVIYEGGLVADFVRHTLAWLNLYACGPMAFVIAGSILASVLTSFEISCDVQLYCALLDNRLTQGNCSAATPIRRKGEADAQSLY